MSDQDLLQATCRHCGRTITEVAWGPNRGWAAGVDYGKGMILCRPALDAGRGRLHEPIPATPDTTGGQQPSGTERSRT